jgi:hypothetical protein
MDYVNIELKNIDIEKLSQSKILNFICEISKTTGEVYESILTAKYMFCTIEIKMTKDEKDPSIPIKQYVTFKGSIHKMWNELNGIKSPNYINDKTYKGFNGNQFSIVNIFEVRRHLEYLFNCGSNQMVFHGLEFGVNTTPLFNPKLFIKGLLYHRNKEFQFTYYRNTALAEHQRWNFKIYSKSFQYEMNQHILRVELKIVKMKDINCYLDDNGIENKDRVGIETFADVNENTLKKAKELLLKRFDEVMYYDYTINKKSLSKTDLKNIKNYSSQNYWIYDLQPHHRDRPKKNLKSIIIKNSDNLQQQIRNNIIEKCVINNRYFESSKCVINNPLTILLSTTQKEPKKISILYPKREDTKNTLCKVTGFNISMQKSNSILLSHTGLKYYYETDKIRFEQIKRRYLPKRWSTTDYETQIKEIAHNIRNKNNNQNIKQIKIYPIEQKNLLCSLMIKPS